MKCSILGLCFSLSFVLSLSSCEHSTLESCFLKTLIWMPDIFFGPCLISHKTLSWWFVKASSGRKTALVFDFYVCACSYACFLVCSCLISFPYLCDPGSVHHCGFGLWIVMAKLSSLCCVCNMYHMLIQANNCSTCYPASWWLLLARVVCKWSYNGYSSFHQIYICSLNIETINHTITLNCFIALDSL